MKKKMRKEKEKENEKRKKIVNESQFPPE